MPCECVSGLGKGQERRKKCWAENKKLLRQSTILGFVGIPFGCPSSNSQTFHSLTEQQPPLRLKHCILDTSASLSFWQLHTPTSPAKCQFLWKGSERRRTFFLLVATTQSSVIDLHTSSSQVRRRQKFSKDQVLYMGRNKRPEPSHVLLQRMLLSCPAFMTPYTWAADVARLCSLRRRRIVYEKLYDFVGRLSFNSTFCARLPQKEEDESEHETILQDFLQKWSSKLHKCSKNQCCETFECWRFERESGKGPRYCENDSSMIRAWTRHPPLGIPFFPAAETRFVWTNAAFCARAISQKTHFMSKGQNGSWRYWNALEWLIKCSNLPDFFKQRKITVWKSTNCARLSPKVTYCYCHCYCCCHDF